MKQTHSLFAFKNYRFLSVVDGMSLQTYSTNPASTKRHFVS